MRLWWTMEGCEVEAAIGEGSGVHLQIDDAGVVTRAELGRASSSTVEEPFVGLRDRLEIDAALLRPELLDAARSADNHHIVLLSERGKATLDGALWPASIVLETKGAKSPTWPKGLVWKKKAPRSRTRKMSTERGKILLHTAENAIAITCLYTGVVALFRGGSMTPSLLRLPLESGLHLRAVATTTGLLAAVTSSSGRGALVHYADDGTLLGKRSLPGIVAVLPTTEGRAIVLVHPEGGPAARLHVVRLSDPTLADQPAVDGAERPGIAELNFAATALAVADDGRLAVSDGQTLLRGHIDGQGLSLAAPISLLEKPRDDDATKNDHPSESDDPNAGARDDGAAPQVEPESQSQSQDLGSGSGDTDKSDEADANTDPQGPGETREGGEFNASAPPDDSDASPPGSDATSRARDGDVASADAADAADVAVDLLDPPPALGLGVGGPPARGWGGKAAHSFEITLRLRSLGRASQGVVVEAGGEALTRGLVQLLEVCADGRASVFQPSDAGMRRATLSELTIPAGIREPDPNKTAPESSTCASEALAASHIELTIRALGIRPGNGLLALRVGVLDSSAPQLRRLRPVTIR